MANDVYTYDKDGKEIYVGLDKNSPPIDYLKMHQAGELPQPTQEQLICELQLLSLGDFFPLNLEIDTYKLQQELEPYQGKWVPYLPRAGRSNNRTGLLLMGLPGDSPFESLSLPEARLRTQKPLLEKDFSVPTSLYHELSSVHSLFEYFMPLGRSFFVKCNEAGWFPPHRDGRWIFRDTFRLIVFCRNCRSDQYDWILDNQKLNIEEGRVYYINTRKKHRTVSYIDNSLHLIMNVPVTLTNVLKLLTYT